MPPQRLHAALQACHHGTVELLFDGFIVLVWRGGRFGTSWLSCRYLVKLCGLQRGRPRLFCPAWRNMSDISSVRSSIRTIQRIPGLPWHSMPSRAPGKIQRVRVSHRRAEFGHSVLKSGCSAMKLMLSDGHPKPRL